MLEETCLHYCDDQRYIIFIKRFSEEQAKFYICEVLTVLEYLHSVKVVYRDLKPEVIETHLEYFVRLYWTY